MPPVAGGSRHMLSYQEHHVVLSTFCPGDYQHEYYNHQNTNTAKFITGCWQQFTKLIKKGCTVIGWSVMFRNTACVESNIFKCRNKIRCILWNTARNNTTALRNTYQHNYVNHLTKSYPKWSNTQSVGLMFKKQCSTKPCSVSFGRFESFFMIYSLVLWL